MAYSVGGESSSTSDIFYSTPQWKYDVFLSFAGKDTRLNFTGHLYDAFNRSGIRCFRDDVDLERGRNIMQDLSQAIEDSLCAVVVISKTYANSKWCLNELLKILESQKTLRRRVFPIFYNVDPADVRKQTKSFGKAFANHEKKFGKNSTLVQNWRNALIEIGNIAGEDARGKHEADLIKNIVGKIWTYLSLKLPSHDDNQLVGIESRVNDMVSILEIGLDDKRFVGIWGMGGVGKTTLARVVFEKLSYKFELCCFLANVRETLLQRDGLVYLQKSLLSRLKIKDTEIYDAYEGMKMIIKLLCHKKVLLVLDDLDDVRQLKNLAENPNWFGKGSRIIITTRDSQLLNLAGVGQRIYGMKTMKEDESLQLFSNKAFKKDHPEENYLELSRYVVKYAGGLPLALQVLGSFLYGRSEDEWRDALDRLKKFPDESICRALKISYDELNKAEKTIFLDIACFFNHSLKKEVTPILESCGLHPIIGIKVLIQKTLLVETKRGRLEMHDLLVKLGKDLINEESGHNVCNRTRLWEFEDIKKVLENNKGSEAIEAIVMKDDFVDRDKIKVHPDAFSKMSNIRLFLLGFEFSTDSPLILPRGLKHFGASKLKFIRWSSYPFRTLPLPLDDLVHLQMRESDIKQLWNGNPLMDKLKFIDLSDSDKFSTTPDFSRVPFLEHLRLTFCISLVKVHSSLGKLEKLTEVYFDHCENLEILPRKLETNSLIKLDLSFCTKVAVLPEFGEGMKKLSYLDVRGTAITTLPESLGHLTSLIYLNLTSCKVSNLGKVLKTCITCEISGFNVTWLTELHARFCGLSDRSIPDDFDGLSSLIALDLSFNEFVNLPTGCFSRLSRLVFLSLDGCYSLKSLPRLPPQLIRLEACYCDSMEPLSDRQLWSLVASLDHEYHGRIKYVISYDKYEDILSVSEHDEPKCLLPLRDFCAIIPRCEIPSWFSNKEYCHQKEYRREYVIKVNIPPSLRDSEWSRLVVCFDFIFNPDYSVFSWSTKAAEDDDCICKEWAHFVYPIYDRKGYLCIMVLELNEETCWQHLRASNNTLHIKFVGSFTKYLRGCGWRVICKEEIQKWCNDNDFNQLTQSQLASPHDEINLPSTVFNRFIMNGNNDSL